MQTREQNLINDHQVTEREISDESALRTAAVIGGQEPARLGRVGTRLGRKWDEGKFDRQ